MKQAVIVSGGQQHIVSEGSELRVDLLPSKKKLTFKPLLVIDGKSVQVGRPTVEGYKVVADVLQGEVKGDKLTVLKFKPKKRIRKRTGHRQRYSVIKISKIGK